MVSAIVVHILNLSLTSTIPGKSPFKVLTRSKPSCAHFRVFGFQAFVHVLRNTTSSLVFVGYNSISKFRLQGEIQIQMFLRIPLLLRGFLDGHIRL